jgi:phosphoadenosine phosphosulfate reductase
MENLDAKVGFTLGVLREAEALGHVALASSLSAEDMVLTDMIARNALNIGIFAIDTGMLHAETLALLDQAQTHYALQIDVYHPKAQDTAAYIAAHGKHAFYESLELRHACCDIRKVAPLEQALVGKAGWITGQRRTQGVTRSDLAHREADAKFGIAKFNPLADWDWDDVMAYVKAHNVPINPLHARGYPSIGCATCTKAVRPGEDPRAGRWWWEQSDAKECGLHVKDAVS